MGPKRCLVIAAVAQVPETYWNMQVLIELTGLNEIKFKLSQDLKLINIIIGITTFQASIHVHMDIVIKMKKQVYGTKEKTEHLKTLVKCKRNGVKLLGKIEAD